LEDPGLDGRKVLKKAFRKLVISTFDLLVNFNSCHVRPVKETEVQILPYVQLAQFDACVFMSPFTGRKLGLVIVSSACAVKVVAVQG
jgi:hypothetical protein